MENLKDCEFKNECNDEISLICKEEDLETLVKIMELNDYKLNKIYEN